jgi:hypothetical protein
MYVSSRGDGVSFLARDRRAGGAAGAVRQRFDGRDHGTIKVHVAHVGDTRVLSTNLFSHVLRGAEFRVINLDNGDHTRDVGDEGFVCIVQTP